MDALTIVIRSSDDSEGYLFDIYKGEPDCPMEDSADGGLCTTTMLNALGMAVSQAETLIKRVKGDECPGCGLRMTINDLKGLSRFGNGTMCGECCTREALEGDFIGER